ncbi:pheromone-processing carboxypeptidase KEX1-like protein [Cinnamomum micranthum f. kanehirae]|uniref:Pheromone-processing carboxypeptidase KEX1-like protein n=1 Tax=Cinnamomum micranthum f. kanehirae TaxID=337451 RepID=A0A3S3PFE4_9MAGN|nr:pheromone-processing carboxypeptidase KEX1-like protein [Cinnamomum micranthum f. kanehirae]
MSGGGRRNKGSANNKNEDSEVEELLRAAEDDMLLNLSIHSHTSRSNPFDADLARRFEALKMPKPSSSSNITKSPKPNKEEEEKEEKEERQVTTGSLSSLQVDENLKMILGSDLSARFAALRKGSSSSSSSIPSKDFQGHSGKSNDHDDDEVDGDGVSKKEVDKLIQWAMDAARLDPSISSDDDGGVDDDSDIDEEEEEEEEEEDKKKKKKKKKGGIKKKKE